MTQKTCKDCNEQKEVGNYYSCRKYKWLIDIELGNSQRVCDFDS